ncbi:MAG: hypothetical protein RLZZ09_3257 [Pseudomonadota bacterium]|jgi:hypothetical protein
MLLNNTAKKKKTKWDRSSLEQIAKSFASRSDFAAKNKSAYEACRIRGLLDEWFDHKLTQWTEELIRCEAAKYTSRTEFANNAGSAYNAARRMNLLPTLYDSMLKTWSFDAIKCVAQTCENKKQFKRKNATAYNAALRLGVIDELFENQIRVNSRDCVYMWAVNEEFDLYKVGITSEKMGNYRVHQVAKEAGVTPTILFIRKVGYDLAKKIERQMKKIGRPYKFPKKFFGHSEFRYMTPNEVQQCINLSKGV